MQELMEGFLALNARAAARGEYEAAYHALMGALHLVDHSGDLASLERIGELARRQDDDIERIRPSHHLSRGEASRRGQVSIYASARVHVDAVRLRLQSARQIVRNAATR